MHDGDREILDHFIRTRNKTIELVEAIPDEWLNRQAEGEEKPLGALLDHIARGVDYWMGACMKDGVEADRTPRETSAALVGGLKASRDRLVAFFELEDGAPMGRTYSRVNRQGQQESFVGRNRILYLTQHEAHHRGKIVLALRQWGFDRVPFLPY